jgi:hypothetical protein
MQGFVDEVFFTSQSIDTVNSAKRGSFRKIQRVGIDSVFSRKLSHHRSKSCVLGQDP